MGAFMAGMLRGFGQEAERRNLLELQHEVEYRRGLADYMLKASMDPSFTPEAQQLATQNYQTIISTPHNKKLPKEVGPESLLRVRAQVPQQVSGPATMPGVQAPEPPTPFARMPDIPEHELPASYEMVMGTRPGRYSREELEQQQIGYETERARQMALATYPTQLGLRRAGGVRREEQISGKQAREMFGTEVDLSGNQIDENGVYIYSYNPLDPSDVMGPFPSRDRPAAGGRYTYHRVYDKDAKTIYQIMEDRQNPGNYVGADMQPIDRSLFVSPDNLDARLMFTGQSSDYPYSTVRSVTSKDFGLEGVKETVIGAEAGRKYVNVGEAVADAKRGVAKAGAAPVTPPPAAPAPETAAPTPPPAAAPGQGNTVGDAHLQKPSSLAVPRYEGALNSGLAKFDWNVAKNQFETEADPTIVRAVQQFSKDVRAYFPRLDFDPTKTPRWKELWTKSQQTAQALMDVYDNPDTFSTAYNSAEKRQIKEGARFLGLPTPGKVDPMLKNQEDFAILSLLMAREMRNLVLTHPSMLGWLKGREGNVDQLVGKFIFGDDPVSQTIRTRLTYYLAVEAKALIGARPPIQWIQQMAKVTANPRMEPKMLLAALDATIRQAQDVVDTANRVRWGRRVSGLDWDHDMDLPGAPEVGDLRLAHVPGRPAGIQETQAVVRYGDGSLWWSKWKSQDPNDRSWQKVEPITGPGGKLLAKPTAPPAGG